MLRDRPTAFVPHGLRKVKSSCRMLREMHSVRGSSQWFGREREDYKAGLSCMSMDSCLRKCFRQTKHIQQISTTSTPCLLRTLILTRGKGKKPLINRGQPCTHKFLFEAVSANSTPTPWMKIVGEMGENLEDGDAIHTSPRF